MESVVPRLDGARLSFSSELRTIIRRNFTKRKHFKGLKMCVTCVCVLTLSLYIKRHELLRAS